jgi:cold shock CspA family protein
VTTTRQATVGSFDPQCGSGTVLLDDGTPLAFGAEAFADSGFRLLRSGQRVQVLLDGDSLRVSRLRMLYT